MGTISQQVSRPDCDDLGEPEPIEPIFPAGGELSLETWEVKRKELRTRWAAVIGTPPAMDFNPSVEKLDRFDQPGYTGTIFVQRTGPKHARPCS